MYTVEEFDEQKTRVLKYILYKRRTEYEVRKKFSRVVQEDILEDVIDYLKKANYINDIEYIEKAVNNFIALKNLSIRELTYKLQTKGLKKEDIEDYIYNNKEELEDYECKSISKIKNKKQTSMDMEEIKQYLLKKGYQSENIKKALPNV